MAELVGNAVKFSPPGGTVRLFAGPCAGKVVVAVWDPDDRTPERRTAPEPSLEALDLRPENFDRNGGRGLLLVESLAREWWIERTDPGKWVCAALDV